MSANRMLQLGLFVVGSFFVPASVQAQTCKTPQVVKRISDLVQRIDSYEKLIVANPSRPIALEERLRGFKDEYRRLDALPPCTVTSPPRRSPSPGVPVIPDREKGISG